MISEEGLTQQVAPSSAPLWALGVALGVYAQKRLLAQACCGMQSPHSCSSAACPSSAGELHSAPLCGAPWLGAVTWSTSCSSLA